MQCLAIVAMRQLLSRPPTPNPGGFRDYLSEVKKLKIPQSWGI